MIKVDVISGFLGAGKTTLIKKLFSHCFKNEKVVLIENEFGEIGIDGAFLKDAGVNIKEINSGCICCSLVGNFADAMKEMVQTYNPDRIIIEPSGVGKLSDIVKAVKGVDCDLHLNVVATVVDGGKVKMYARNFGEFYNDQVINANTIIMSKTDKTEEKKIMEGYEILRAMNERATIVTTPINQLNGEKILSALEEQVNLIELLVAQLHAEHHHDCCCHEYHHDHDDNCCCHEHHHDHDDDCCCHEHHHEHDDDCCCHEHHHDHDEDCCCHEHHHDHDDDCCCHEHHHEHDDDCCCHEHHHEHDDDCCCHEHHHDHDEDCCCHEHHHEHDDDCCCHEHHHEHHHHHHAEEVFASWGKETVKAYAKRELESILTALASGDYGLVLRSKGILKANDSENWYYFDFVAGDWEIREGEADVVGRAVVIGSELKEEAIEKLFN